jgi:hypothetical protein
MVAIRKRNIVYNRDFTASRYVTRYRRAISSQQRVFPRERVHAESIHSMILGQPEHCRKAVEDNALSSCAHVL